MATSSNLCAVCIALNFEELSKTCEGRYVPSRLSRAQLHQPNFESLVSSAKTCILCAHFLKTWVNCPSHRNVNESDEENEERIYMLERLDDEFYQEPKKALCKLHREKDWSTTDDALSWPKEVRAGEWPPPGIEDMLGSFTVRGAIVKGIDDSQGIYGLTLQRIQLLDNSLWINSEISRNWTNLSCVADDVSWVAGRPLGANTVVNLGLHWLERCSKTHTSCGPLKDTEMPTRVIDVGEEGIQEPKLIETNGRPGQWVTLSYPWGGAPPITTRFTYDDNLEEMPMASLPPMFQDVVRVVRGMGFRYLWIDSICIIQGDAEDWAKECGRMAQVYEYSAFTIAACAASSPQDTLTPSSRANDTSPCTFEKGGVRFVASLDDMIEYGDISMPREWNSVIATRGWCFQERLLAPRVLYLGSRQPYWECHTCQFYEFLRVPFPLTGDKPATSTIGVTHTISKSIFGINETFKPESWLDMVESYSRCNLTSNMDKLPALSGIAQAAAKRINDTYLAGIWLEQLNRGLAWLCDPYQRKLANTSAEYRAPSWSWASINEPVEFYSPKGSFTPEYEVLSAETTPATSDPFGRVSAGVLTLSGHILELELTPSMRQPARENYDENNKTFTVDFWPDRVDKNGNKARKLPCLLLGGNTDYAGLALEKIEGQPRTFRRVGFVYSSSFMYDWRVVDWLREKHRKKWLKRERKTIRIV